jgi:hypothetical protein
MSQHCTSLVLQVPDVLTIHIYWRLDHQSLPEIGERVAEVLHKGLPDGKKLMGKASRQSKRIDRYAHVLLTGFMRDLG